MHSPSIRKASFPVCGAPRKDILRAKVTQLAILSSLVPFFILFFISKISGSSTEANSKNKPAVSTIALPPMTAETVRPVSQQNDKPSSEPTSTEAIARADELLKDQQWPTAETLLKDAFARDSANRDLLLFLAKIALQYRQDKKAGMDFLQQAFTLNPADEALGHQLVELYSVSGQLAAGLEFFLQLKRNSSPKNTVIPLTIARIYKEMGRPDQSVPYLQEASQDPKADAQSIRKQLADSYIEMNSPDQAVELLENFDSSSLPRDEVRELELRLAKAYYLSGDAAFANRVLTEWLQLYPDDTVAAAALKEFQSGAWAL